MQASNSANQHKAAPPPPELPAPPPPPPQQLDMRLYEKVHCLASSKAVVIFANSDCCMLKVVESLLDGFGARHDMVELDHCPDGAGMHEVLCQIARTNEPIPAIFIGGNYFGGVQTLLASHLNGNLIPLLKEARAMWL